MDGWNVPQPDLYGTWTTDSHRADQRTEAPQGKARGGAGRGSLAFSGDWTGKRTLFVDRDNWGNEIKLTPAPAGRAN
ncbi:hypothetical protein VCV18_005780 [Metarhizium anisopliae]